MKWGSSHRHRLKAVSFAYVLAILAAVGQTSAASAQDSGQSLDQAASDPTASLMSFQIQDFYTYDYHNSGATANRLQFRAAIPFELGGTSNIARFTLPFFTDSPSGADGISDATFFNLTTFTQSWGRWGVGAVALLPTGTSGLSAEKWALGPAAGFSVQADEVLWGVFNQNLVTVAGDDDMPDVNLSTLQPIFNVGLGNGWSTGLSEMVFTYDWDANEFTSLPLGVKLSKLKRIRGTPVQFIASYEHNFYDERIAPSDTVSFTVKILIPKG